jgi:predicted RNase H-like HicB family nuclease
MTLKEYMEQPYNISVEKINDESGIYYYASILELPGCHSDGDSESEAKDNLKEAMELYLESAIEEGMHIPKPLKHNENYSGKVLLRMPKSLHANLSAAAKVEGVSLNQYILYKLSDHSSKAS